NLCRADLRGVDLRRANLRGSRLSKATLEKADLRGADLRGAELMQASLKGALYDRRTRWPFGLWPPEEKCTRREEPSEIAPAPPPPARGREAIPSEADQPAVAAPPPRP